MKKDFSKLARVAFCHGRGKRAITSPIIFSPFGEVSLSVCRQTTSCFSSKKSKRNQMIIFNGPVLPAGYRNTDGSYNNLGNNTNVWSSLESDTNAWRRNLNYTYTAVNRNANNKLYGFSVRCLKRWFTLLNSLLRKLKIKDFYLTG